MHRNNKKTGILGIIITIIILILLVFLSNLDTGKLSYLENAFSSLVMPIQNGLTYLKNKFSGNDAFFTDIANLKEENQELKNANSELEKKLRELEIIKAENYTLKELVNLKEKYTDYKAVPAYIINKDISNYSENIIINVGTKEGIKEGMTVIADAGLVGHIISVTENTAKVQTIVDTSSIVSSIISSSRDGIIVRGTQDSNNTLKATYIAADSNVVQGEMIETSRNRRNISKRNINRKYKTSYKYKKHYR